MLLSYLNIMLLGWEALFCLIAAITLVGAPPGEKKHNLIWMQISAALLLGLEAAAWYYQGRPGDIARWMVRLANLGTFLLNFSVLLLFHRYLCCTLLTVQERARLHLVKAVELVCYIGMILVIVSQFTNLYYYIDGNNNYVRSPYFPLSLLAPSAGIIMDGILLVKHRERISPWLYRVMMFYILTPLVAALLQTLSYGLSLISLSIGGAMLLIYLIVNREQQAQLRQVQEDKAVVAQRLEIAQTLNRCVQELSSDKEISQAICDLLQIIQEYFRAERTCIYEIDFASAVAVDTYESSQSGKTCLAAQPGASMQLPLSMIATWMKQFQKGRTFYIANAEQEKGTPHYRFIKEQGIQRLLTVPLMEQGRVIGFMGVSNPQQHYEDETLLSSLQYFVTNSLRQKKEEEFLRKMSFHDQLTGLYNRNRYNLTLKNWGRDCQNQVGILYLDLDGLKWANDNLGHAAGDLLIRNTAQTLEETFPGQAYRIGGDEFVVIRQGIPEEDFRREIDTLMERAKEKNVSFSTGIVWQPHCPDLTAALREADNKMYEEKRAHHKARTT